MEDNLLAPLDTLPEELAQMIENTYWDVLENITNKFEGTVIASTPVKTGKLLGSIKVEKVDTRSSIHGHKIGYKLEFYGYRLDNKGHRTSAFQVIANSLNHGWIDRWGHHHPGITSSNGSNAVEDKDYYNFIKKNIKILRQINEELNKKYNENIEILGEKYG